MQRQITRKKFVATIILLAVTFVVTMAAGIAMVMNSGAYIEAQSEIARQ